METNEALLFDGISDQRQDDMVTTMINHRTTEIARELVARWRISAALDRVIAEPANQLLI